MIIIIQKKERSKSLSDQVASVFAETCSWGADESWENPCCWTHPSVSGASSSSLPRTHFFYFPLLLVYTNIRGSLELYQLFFLPPNNVTVCLPSWQTLHQTTGEIFWEARCAVFYFPPYILLKSRFLTVAMETQPHRDPSLGDTLLKWFFFFLFRNST